jgi:5-carboxymethyl-2-hydroxymuconate isomerase
MKKLWGWIRRRIQRVATAVLKHAGMAVVSAEDWTFVLATSTKLYAYVHTSGHINNGRHRSKKVLYKLTEQLMTHAREDVIVQEVKQ